MVPSTLIWLRVFVFSARNVLRGLSYFIVIWLVRIPVGPDADAWLRRTLLFLRDFALQRLCDCSQGAYGPLVCFAR
jgi:hypothetical protein